MSVLPRFTAPEPLGLHLRQLQALRQTRIALTIGRPMADRCSIPRLRTLLDMLLPLVQSRSGVVRRERDGSWYVQLTLRYREGVRMADAWQAGDVSALTEAECAALAQAQAMICPCLSLPEQARARYLLEQVRSLAVYDNPPRGCAACAPVIGAAGVLRSGHANCQGYSDLFFLLARLAGLTVTCQAGWKHREAHLWNLLRLEGRWLAVDATSGGLCMTRAECLRRGLRWERWAEAAPLDECELLPDV